MTRFETDLYYLLLPMTKDKGEAYSLSNDPEFKEGVDKDIFEEVMGEIEMTDENLIKYYEMDEYHIELILEAINERDELKYGNYNAWRNS